MKREYPSCPIVGVGVVIVNDGKLLLIKRGAEPSLGRWSFPGGVVELGESVRDAAVRETKEECGLDVELVTGLPMDVYDIMVPDENGVLKYHYVLLQFLARPKQGTLKPTTDVTDAKWVPLNEVETYDLAKSIRSFFTKHRSKLELC